MGGQCPPVCGSEIGPEGIDDLIGTLQTVADNQAEGLSALGSAVELANPGTVHHVPGDDVSGLEQLVAGHRVACELKSV